MLLNENAMAKLLQKASKHGYDVIVDRESLIVKTEIWLISMSMYAIPRKVLGTLVEHMGILPQATASLTVIKGADNQELMLSMAKDEISSMRNAVEAAEAKPTPIMLRGMALWQIEDQHQLYAVPAGMLSLLESPERSAMVLDGNRFMWSDEGQTLYLECYRPCTGEEAKRWMVLETVDWIQRD